jgi:hypothetical protein
MWARSVESVLLKRGRGVDAVSLKEHDGLGERLCAVCSAITLSTAVAVTRPEALVGAT